MKTAIILIIYFICSIISLLCCRAYDVIYYDNSEYWTHEPYKKDGREQEYNDTTTVEFIIFFIWPIFLVGILGYLFYTYIIRLLFIALVEYLRAKHKLKNKDNK